MEQQTLAAERPSRAFGLARALGWFSLGLGAAELLMPGTLNRALGIRGGRLLTRSCGAREMAAGVGLLASRRPAPWLWFRLASDVLDLGALGLQVRPSHSRRGAAWAALGLVAGLAALDLIAARRLQGRSWPVRAPAHDYSDRSGWPRPAAQMRGAATGFEVPRDMGTPPGMRFDRKVLPQMRH